MGSRFAVSLVVALCWLVALGGWYEANKAYFEYLLGARVAGAYGTSVADLPTETPAQTQARERHDRELLTKVWWSIRFSQVSAALSLLGAIYLVWATRRDSLRRRFAVAVMSSISLALFIYIQVA